MIKNNYPRVLIFGQSFNSHSGSGITLTNLFKGWPKEKIAVATTGHLLYNVTVDVCNTYYQLGEKEHKWKFPFNLIQKSFPSGMKSFENECGLTINQKSPGIRTKLVDRLFFPFLRWVGLYHCISNIFISHELEEWLNLFHPDLLYIQVSSREAILFAGALQNFLKVPSAIHMMDDWPTTISNKGLLKKYWKKKIDKEFMELLENVEIHLSISDSMSEEYKRRYNKSFIAFHNPIEIDAWIPNCKTDFNLNRDHIIIFYAGRIGMGIKDSLLEVALAIDKMNNDSIIIKLQIQTSTKESEVLSGLQKFKCIEINPYVEYNQLPKIFSQADILLIANDFSKEGIDFLRYSIPTKASEYMISGTPVLVYSSTETAIYKFFKKNDCGYCVSQQNVDEIIKAIKFLTSNEKYRRKISMNAISLAKERFDAKIVREEFQQLFLKIPKRKTYVHE